MTDGERLPGVPDSPDRIVVHVDMDCFYASCERLREPELEGKPVIVGMGYDPGETHGAVATASYEAREYGVESAQAISEAVERLPPVGDGRATAGDDASGDDPAGHYRPVDLDFYESVSEDVRSILRACSDRLRVVSIDEAYLDVTDRTDWSVAEGFGRHVKDRIAREVGVPASVGVAPSMSAAKVASDHDKPDGLVVVRPGDVREFLAPLGVECIHGIGPVRAGELHEMGVETAGDLAETPLAPLLDRFGQWGRTIRRRARGEDDRDVRPRGRPKSLSRESAFTGAVTDPERKRDRIRTLSTAVAKRARSRGALYRTVGVKAVEPPFEVNTRERSLPGPVEDEELLTSLALELFEEFEDVPVRKVGVRVSNLSFPDGEQARLDGYADGVDGRTGREGDGSDRRGSGGPGTGQASLDDFSTGGAR